jgi:hypothetical protein
MGSTRADAISKSSLTASQNVAPTPIAARLGYLLRLAQP